MGRSPQIKADVGAPFMAPMDFELLSSSGWTEYRIRTKIIISLPTLRIAPAFGMARLEDRAVAGYYQATAVAVHLTEGRCAEGTLTGLRLPPRPEAAPLRVAMDGPVGPVVLPVGRIQAHSDSTKCISVY